MNTEQIKAIVSAVIILAANLLAVYGIQLDTDMWVDGVCVIVMLAADAYGIWKNHNFTPEAGQAQVYLDELKAKRNAESE